MALIQQYRTLEFTDGVLVHESEPYDVDVTAQAVTYDLHAKARAALDANAAFLALSSPTNAQTLAQVRRLTRENSALIRLIIGSDLLVENTDT